MQESVILPSERESSLVVLRLFRASSLEFPLFSNWPESYLPDFALSLTGSLRSSSLNQISKAAFYFSENATEIFHVRLNSMVSNLPALTLTRAGPRTLASTSIIFSICR